MPRTQLRRKVAEFQDMHGDFIESPEELRSDRAREQIGQVRRAAIATFVKTSHQLAVLPAHALRVVQLANDPRATITSLAAVVRADPGIAGRVIGTANSMAYSGRLGSAVASLEKAIARIGLSGLRAIALQVSMSARVLRVKGLESEARYIMEHSVYAGVACRGIARALGLDAETAFLIGLIHDTGKIIGLEAVMSGSKELKEALALERTGILPLLVQTHEEIGGFAAAKWGLPKGVITAIEHHHVVPERLFAEQLPMVAHLGDRLAHQLRPSDREEPFDLRECPDAYRLGLTPDAIEKLLRTVPEEAADLLGVLG